MRSPTLIQRFSRTITTVLCLALYAALPSLSGCDKAANSPVAASAATSAAVPLAAAPTPPPPPAGQLQVSFIYVGSVGQGGSTYSHDMGRRSVHQAYGNRVLTRYIENVPEGADAARVMRDQAAQGSTLIFTTVPGFAESAQRVATERSATRFEVNTHQSGSANLRSFDARSYEAAYLAGVLAGGMTRSNSVGVVAPLPSAEVLRNINAFALGAQSSNPKVRTHVEWVREWNNPTREGNAAQLLMQGGADVLLQHTESNAVIKKAEAMGKYAIGWASDMQAYSHTAHLASAIVNWAPYYVKTVGEVLDNRWASGPTTWWGLKDGAVDLVSVSERVPADVKAKVDATRIALKDGSLVIWRGPLRNNDGKEVLKAGELGNDAFLDRIDFYVQGVEGKPLPR